MVITVTSEDPTQATVVSSVTLTFTNANWNVPQVISVFGVADNVVDGNQIVDLSIAIDQPLTTDNAYDGLTTQTVPVTVVDID